MEKSAKKTCDIIAVAGGDGTGGRVARRLIDSRTPIAVLPMGTANNIANTIGVTSRPFKDLIDGRHSHVSRSEDPEEEIGAALKVLSKRLSSFPSKDLTVRLDGQNLSGDYYMLEALNIRYLGPNLDLVPRAQINDGLLDVVFVPKGEQAKLSQYISDRIKRKRSRVKLTVRQGRHLQVECKSSPVHIDDKPWPEDKDAHPILSNAIDIKTDPGALVFSNPNDNFLVAPAANLEAISCV